MEHKICLLGKIFCETLQMNIIKNQYQKVHFVFSTCIITGKVNVHQRVYQNIKFMWWMLSTSYNASILYAHENQNCTDNHIMQIFE